MAKINNDVDRVIKYMNRRLEQFRTTFGVSSQQYQSLVKQIKGIKGIDELIIRDKNGKLKDGKLKIRRSYKANNINITVWQTVASVLGNHDYMKEKQEVMELIRQVRKRKGMTEKEANKRITTREIKEMAERTFQMGSDYEQALQFFYNVDRAADEAETQQAMTIAHRKGKRSYSEMYEVMKLAKELQDRLIREGSLDEAELSYTKIDDSIGVARWTVYTEKGFGA